MKHDKLSTGKGTDENLRYTTYLDERRSLVNSELDVSSRFDKSILTLSGGALLLSMTFVKDIANKPSVTYLLLVAWLLLALAICLMLASLMTSQSAHRKQREILDKSLESPQPARSQQNRLAVTTHRLNVLSIGAFIVGLVFLSVFVAANLPRK